MRFGLIGDPLGHSRSGELHALLADYEYRLWPVKPEALDAFLRAGGFDGINVTIPHKRAVMPYLDQISPQAREVGCVNTVVRRADGKLFGDNTDLYGMEVAARKAGLRLGKGKTLVLGSGGTSLTACALVRQAGGEAVVVSRRGENHYGNLERHADARWLINATPVGMYPQVEESPVDLRRLPALEGILDVVYNPLRTRLTQQAQSLGLPCGDGLTMLVYQAVRACELFTGRPVPPQRIQRAQRLLRSQAMNVVLVGMPGVGKSTVGALVGRRLGREVVDLDAQIAAQAGMDIPQIFAREGEDGFRAREAETLRRFALEGGRVLVTGGGAVLEAQNRLNLRANGWVVHLARPLDALPLEGRPLSRDRAALKDMWRRRAPLYAACADAVYDNTKTPDACAGAIEEGWYEVLGAQRAQSEPAGRA